MSALAPAAPAFASKKEAIHGFVLQAVRECDRANFQETFRILVEATRMLGAEEELPPRGISAYGRALAALDPHQRAEAIACCKAAIRRDPVDSLLYYNLAAVYLTAGSRKYAVHTLDAGLRIDPRHAGLKSSRRGLGLRMQPAFPSLGRSHPLNVWVGRIRHRVRRIFRRR